MHIGKLLARLNPTTSSFGGGGSGGKPDLTPQDIAAALAMVPAGVGRELICCLWWPAGAQFSAKELDRLLMEAQLIEWRSRVDVIVTAQIRCAYADSHQQIARANAALDAAKARAWPRLGGESCYAEIRSAVLIELGSASLCQVCGGRGHLPNSRGQVVDCEYCLGGGRKHASDRSRAELIDRDESTYRRAWKPVYEWTEQHCVDLLGPAEAVFKRALGAITSS